MSEHSPGQYEQDGMWTRQELGADPSGRQQYELERAKLHQAELEKRRERFSEFPEEVVRANSNEALEQMREDLKRRSEEDKLNQTLGINRSEELEDSA